MKRFGILFIAAFLASTLLAEKRIYFFRAHNLPDNVETLDLRPDKGLTQLTLNNIYAESEARYALFTKHADSWWQLMLETVKGRTVDLQDVNDSWFVKLKIRRTVNYTLTLVLAGAGTANGYPLPVAKLPADGEWHTLTIPLSDFPMAPAFSDKFSGKLLQIHSDLGYAGDIIGIDYCYLTDNPSSEDPGTVQPQKRYYFITNTRTPLTGTPYAVVDYSSRTDIRANGWMQWSYVPFPYYSMDETMPVTHQISLTDDCPMSDINSDWYIIAQIRTSIAADFVWSLYLDDGTAFMDTLRASQLKCDGKTWNRVCLSFEQMTPCIYTDNTPVLLSLSSLAAAPAGEWSMASLMLTNEPSAADPEPVVPGDPSQEKRIYLLNDGTPLPANMNCIDYRLDQTDFLSVAYGNNTTRKTEDPFLTLLPTNGWWSADIAAKTSVDLTDVDDTWTMHTRVRTTSAYRPVNLILYKENNAQLARYELTDKLLPVAQNGNWFDFDIPMSEFLATNASLINYTSRIFSFHSDNGGTAGVEVSMEYLYFSHEGESSPDPQPGLPPLDEPALEPAPAPVQEGIDTIQSSDSQSSNQKLLIDGHLFIRVGEKLIDILGRTL